MNPETSDPYKARGSATVTDTVPKPSVTITKTEHRRIIMASYKRGITCGLLMGVIVATVATITAYILMQARVRTLITACQADTIECYNNMPALPEDTIK